MTLTTVSCGIGTQHYAKPGASKTLCGRTFEYATSAKFNPKIDCRRCAMLAVKNYCLRHDAELSEQHECALCVAED